MQQKADETIENSVANKKSPDATSVLKKIEKPWKGLKKLNSKAGMTTLAPLVVEKAAGYIASLDDVVHNCLLIKVAEGKVDRDLPIDPKDATTCKKDAKKFTAVVQGMLTSMESTFGGA